MQSRWLNVTTIPKRSTLRDTQTLHLKEYIDGLVQESRDSTTNALELHRYYVMEI